MHVCFIPYGKRTEVELLFRDMEAQKHQFIMKRGKEKYPEKKELWIQGVVRQLPFGIYEYVFPKESLDLVLTSLTCDVIPYNIPKMPLRVLMKFLKLKPIPKFKKDKQFMWLRENVAVIPIGIREDGVLLEPEGMQYAGWEHERL